MEYRTGEDKPISEIGIGCYGLSGAYGRKAPEQFIDLARRAYELGVTYFDTADVYGPAEEVLGRAVSSFRDEVWIATKVGGGADGRPDCSPTHVISSCEHSLTRLGTDCIDLYQIHFDDPGTTVEETVGALEQLKKDGKIRRYGVGHLPLARVKEYVEKGDIFSELVELSAVSRGAREEILPLCGQQNVAVIAFSPTGRGLLTGKISPETEFERGDIRNLDALFKRERLQSGLRVAKRLEDLGKRDGKTAAQVAIAWVLAQPAVVCALTGPSTIPHLEENLGASDWTIADADLREFEQFLNEEEERTRPRLVGDLTAILGSKLDPNTAFSDLVYVLETLVELRLATQGEVVPVFMPLFALRGVDSSAVLDELRPIQSMIREQFLDRVSEDRMQ